jgi:hypothetical protein
MNAHIPTFRYPYRRTGTGAGSGCFPFNAPSIHFPIFLIHSLIFFKCLIP